MHMLHLLGLFTMSIVFQFCFRVEACFMEMHT